jgi:RimJ/RimL family protein N-acetyltransferase
VVADNERAIALYQRFGFVDYGRNPRGFLTRGKGHQELVLMALELKDKKGDVTP